MYIWMVVVARRARLCCATSCPWRCHNRRRRGEGVLVFFEDKDGVDNGVVFSVNFSLRPLSPTLPGRLGYFVDTQRFPSAADVFCHHC